MKKVVILFFFTVLSTSITCNIKNCEFCSPSSPSICINCKTGFQRSLSHGCEISHSLTGQNIENCNLAVDFNCIHCSESFKIVSGRCDPICPENCECFEPGKCLPDIFNLSKTSSDIPMSSNENCLENCEKQEFNNSEKSETIQVISSSAGSGLGGGSIVLIIIL
jgi:hypothetical protein